MTVSDDSEPPRGPAISFGRRLRLALPGLSPAERRLARLVLGQIDAETCETLQRLAEASGTSPPTILRFAEKLGFTGYGELKAAILDDRGARRQSALDQFTSSRGVAASRGRHLERAREVLPAALAEGLGGVSEDEFEAVVAALADTSRHLTFAGGRFSQAVADLLYRHLTLIRPGVDLIPFSSQNRLERAADIGRGHVLVVFDFRRYQIESVRLARLAKSNRATVILVTDPWLSPIADRADVVLTTPVASAFAFDTLVPAMALIETLAAAVAERLGEAATQRLERIDALSSEHDLLGGDVGVLYRPAGAATRNTGGAATAPASDNDRRGPDEP